MSTVVAHHLSSPSAPSARSKGTLSGGVFRHAQTGHVPIALQERSLQAKPYEQMTYPGQRAQEDVKAVPFQCIAAP